MKKLITITFLFLAIGFSQDLIAQPPDPGGGGPGNKPGCWPPPCVPIDGGLSFLLVAGVAYGGKKMYDLKNTEEKH